MAKNKNKGSPRNYGLESGVVRFGKSKTYHKKNIFKFVKNKPMKKVAKKAPAFIEKKVGGAKNGGTRKVRVVKLANDYPTLDKAPAGTSKKFFSRQKHSLRASLAPGTIAILLAGLHKGKRVVVLKQLDTGLLMVTGPYKVNGCPMRRVNQRYLLATSTRLDISSLALPEKLNDDYFRRVKASKKVAKKEGDIFSAKKEAYKASDEKKKDQADLDKKMLDIIKKNKEGKLIKSYLRHNFTLSKGQYPHMMAF